MKDKKLFIQTFGCQMNVHDSEQIQTLLSEAGYKTADGMETSDLVILNTCSIREKAAQKVFSELGRIGKIKSKNKKMIVGLCGCLAQQLGEKFHHKFDFLDFVVGTHNIHLLPDIVSSIEKKRDKITKIEFYNDLHSLGIYAKPKKGTITAFVSIMQGCDNFCAYCVVPYLRGPEMSRPPQDIIEEVKKLADDGIREITLLGQNVNSYGKTLKDGIDFPGLIKKISKIPGIERIRFTTSHPRDLSPSLIQCFGDEEKLCQHIHLPVQSGSDRILALMNRGYTIKEYREKVEQLRRVSPNISISSDIIVGFPGETQKDYQETIDMMEKIRFDLTFSFKYSDREGTAANLLKNKVDEREKLRRLQALQELQNRHTYEKNASLVGSTQKILVEAFSKNSDRDVSGRTSSWKIVNFRGDQGLWGKMVDVKITKAYLHSLRGELIEQQGGYES
ncbi:MAG TPA: tRNA (N6-isopentenyl adenosine(37)-C2)-methylthiotransferase MiaB [Smithella sp.]|nr:tRNA (N6-isopentenyl adenosine(37)-C2)-methylthiotransferase MiaB [Smithella sp.]